MFANMSNKSEKSYSRRSYPRKSKTCTLCGLGNDDNVMLHKAPTNEILRDKWCKAIKQELTSSFRICSNHFKKSDYKKCHTKTILVYGSVPIVQLEGGNISETENEPFSNSSQRLSSCDTFNLNNKQSVASESEDLSSSQPYENTNSEEEICYIYYLDEKQNVRYYARHNIVESTCSDSYD